MRLSPDLIDRDSVGATLIYTVEVRGHDGLLQEIVRRGAPMPAASGATTLVPGDPVRVAAVQRIFERYAVLGMGLGGVAAALNREGLPSPFAGMPKPTHRQGADVARRPYSRGGRAVNPARASLRWKDVRW